MRASCGISSVLAEDRKSIGRHGLPGFTALNADLHRRSCIRQSPKQSVHRQSVHQNEFESSRRASRNSLPGRAVSRMSSMGASSTGSRKSFLPRGRLQSGRNKQGTDANDDASLHSSGERAGRLLDEIQVMLMQLRDHYDDQARRQELQISALHEQHFDRLATFIKDTFQKNLHAGCTFPTCEMVPSIPNDTLKVASQLAEDEMLGRNGILASPETASEIDDQDIKREKRMNSSMEKVSSHAFQHKTAQAVTSGVTCKESERDRLEMEESKAKIESRHRLAFSSHPAPKEDAPVCWQIPVSNCCSPVQRVLRLVVDSDKEKNGFKENAGSTSSVDCLPIGRKSRQIGVEDTLAGRVATEPFRNSLHIDNPVTFASGDEDDSMEGPDFGELYSTCTRIMGFGPMAMGLGEGPVELAENWMEEIHEWELNYVSMRRKTLSASIFAQALEGAGFIQEENIWGAVFGDPYSIGNTVWSAVCMLAVIGDLIMIPFQIFDSPETSASRTILLGSTIFWTADFILSFFKGYFEDGTAITSDARKMAMAYLKTWFAMDLVIIVGDWFFYVAVKIVDYRSNNIGFWRFLRAARLLRILKLRKFLKRIEIYVGSAWSSHMLAYFTVMKFIIGILVCNHLVACIFYGIRCFGSRETDWVSIAGLTGADLDEKYIAAFHWSLAHFTGGEVDITVKNSMERIYACLVLLVGLIMVSWLVSTTTNAMLLLAEVDQYKRKQITLIRQFCKQYQLEKGLCYRIQRYVKFAYGDEKRQQMLLHDVEAFQLLSEPLLAEIYHEIYSPCISGPDGHSLFQKIRRKSSILMSKICRNAVALCGLAGGDCAFAPGELARRMYFILGGKFLYRLQRRGAFELYTNQWLGEAALWTTSWTHRGELQAKMESDLLMVDAGEFATTIRAHPRTYIWVQKYAKRYVEDMNLTNSSGRSTDLNEPCDEPSARKPQKAYDSDDIDCSNRRLSSNEIDTDLLDF